VNKRVVLLMFVLAILAGCSTARFKAQADKEVYEIIRHKQEVALGIERPFSIDQEKDDPLVALPLRQTEILGDIASEEAVLLSLPQALEIASKNNRDYQARKEDVYLKALDLTLARHQWGPIFTGKASTAYTKKSEDETVGGGTEFGFTKVFADGTKLGAKLSTNLLMHLVRSPREAASSLISATLTKPLWRGAGKRIAQENLLQSERDVVYTIRSFAQYHRSFAVSVASSYYRALQGRDSVLNSWNNYQNLILARKRSEMMAEAGRLPEFHVDQATQDELRAKDNYVRAVQSYKQSIDEFKLKLGLPTDAAVALDPAELTALRDRGILHPELNADKAVNVALAARLDLLNVRDQMDDAGRKVDVAKNGLAPGVNLVLASSVPSEENKPGIFVTREGTYSAGIDMDLPIDRYSERNTYRRTLISLDRAVRSASLFEDQVKLDVREAWRKLQEARDSYEIQRISLQLAQRRVQSTTLLLEAGRADTRDLLEAHDSLLQAQNAVTRALIDHTIARLEFWRNIGILEVNENGLWQENYERFFEQGGDEQ